jgi:cyclic pyranopterin phosphate synthase
MPRSLFGEPYRFVDRDELLQFSEIARVAQVFAELGVHKVRLTGGEPLLRPALDDLVALLSAIPGIDDIALTTNGSLLTPEKARLLREAGLRRVTISLDSLHDGVFQAINDVGFPVSKVLRAIDAAAEAGLPVKVNMVVRRDVNDQDVLPMAEHFRGSTHVVRFIEYMDAGNLNGWRKDQVVPAQEILARIAEHWPLEPVSPVRFGEVAKRYRYLDGQGEIGIIASITQPFCASCTRARLSADGRVFTCLFGTKGHDLRSLLRAGANDDSLRSLLHTVWAARGDQYSALRATLPRSEDASKIEMYQIGG